MSAEELDKLASLGYVSAVRSDTKSDATASDAPDSISYGYQVPSGPIQALPLENLDSRLGPIADGERKAYNSPNVSDKGTNVPYPDSHAAFDRSPETEQEFFGCAGDIARHDGGGAELATHVADAHAIPVQIIGDSQSHSLTVTASAKDRSMIEAYAQRIDAQTADDRINQIYLARFSTDTRTDEELREAMRELVAQERPDLTEADSTSAAVDDATQPTPVGASQEEELPAPPMRRVPAQPRPKIIKTGELGIEVSDYVPAYEQVQAVVAPFRAFVADVNTQEGTGGAVTGRVAIRVVPEEFEALFAALKAVGRVESENVKAADVTARYIDLEARITAAQINEARLQELVKSKSIIDKMSALLEVERELARVREEIERMQGQLRVMADRIALSSITVTLREPARTVPSASLSIEVPVLDEAAGALGETVEKLAGRLTSGKVSRRGDGTFRGDYELEVTLAAFDEVLHAIESLGRVEGRQVKDRQFSDASAPWAGRVKCRLALVLYESARELPTGQVVLQVDTLAPAVARLSEVLEEHGGAVCSNRTTRRDDGSSVANLKLGVAAGTFAELTVALDALGRITAKQLSGDVGAIHGGMADVLCDLTLTLAERPRQIPSGNMTVEVEDFEAARQRISALVGQKGVHVLSSASNKRSDGTTVGSFRLGIKSADMEAVVARLESLGRVDSRSITGLGLGDLSTADPDALGVIEVSVGEKAAIAPAPERAGNSIRARLTDGLAGLYNSLGLIVYGLMAMAPWVIVVLAVAWGVTRTIRKRRPVAAPKAEQAS